MMLSDEEIKALAYQAGKGETGRREFSADVAWLLAFARSVEAAERERCAAVCEGVREAADHAARDGHRKTGAMASAALCAKLIRA